MNITLLGEPKSTQHIYKMSCVGGFARMYMSSEGKALKESYQWQAKSQHSGPPFEGPVSVSIVLYFQTKRQGDWDNFHKISMDALTGIVWVDDKQIKSARVTMSYDKKNPRIEIEVSRLS
jgi:Holliday junction resolvase RusA-like endonuclease